jgi:hypothetical protein
MKDISFALNGELVTAKLGSRVEKKDLQPIEGLGSTVTTLGKPIFEEILF